MRNVVFLFLTFFTNCIYAQNNCTPNCTIHYNYNEPINISNYNPSPTIPLPSSLNALELQSFPEAKAVVYLDFDGFYRYIPHIVIKPNDGSNIINAPASNYEDADIREIWEVVSEDFRPFNINITTDSMVFENAPKHLRVRVVISPYCNQLNACASAGVAGVLISNTSDEPIYAWSSEFFRIDPVEIGGVISHEIGHSFGLSHDGKNQSGYYFGHNGWTPIMGTGFLFNQLAQWSLGEYDGATNQEDDLNLIAHPRFGVGFRNDDHGNEFEMATALKTNIQGILTNENNGVITKPTDVDYFYFETSGGMINISIQPNDIHPNLDIQVRLFNQNHQLINTYNPSNSLGVNIATSLSAGIYYLEIDGVGKGTVNNGYSDYGSLGYFSVSGTINGFITQTGIASINLVSPLNHQAIEQIQFWALPIQFALQNDDLVSEVWVEINDSIYKARSFNDIYSVLFLPYAYTTYQAKIFVKHQNGSVVSQNLSFEIVNPCYQISDNSSFSILSINSEETFLRNGRANNLIDGDLGTSWSSSFNNFNSYPFEVVVDRNQTQNFDGIYLGLPISGYYGNLIYYSLQVSSDAITWNNVIENGVLNATEVNHYLPYNGNSRYIKLIADTPSFNNELFVSLAEIAVYDVTCAYNSTAPEIIFVSHYHMDVVTTDFSQPELVYLSINDTDGEITSAFLEVEGQIFPLSFHNQLYQTHWLPQSSGTKVLKVTAFDNEGNSFTEQIEVEINATITSTTNLISVDDFKVYPNPTADVITIEVGNFIAAELWTLDGRFLEKYYTYSINLSSYAKGTYLLKVKSYHQNYQSIIIKQ
jgi:hypothetical protein